eukprot:TRINITY_DN67071_c1_g3_i1.p2 TRINITY_DN67071_c1_g3~~TRINITY_DN67071_c1_g3_i1.p2  ORF type:complete len:298 (-),score=40.37 TRINITY_DN67071_c1_g3_i1:1489-2382(-)
MDTNQPLRPRRGLTNKHFIVIGVFVVLGIFALWFALRPTAPNDEDPMWNADVPAMLEAHKKYENNEESPAATDTGGNEDHKVEEDIPEEREREHENLQRGLLSIDSTKENKRPNGNCLRKAVTEEQQGLLQELQDFITSVYPKRPTHYNQGLPHAFATWVATKQAKPTSIVELAPTQQHTWLLKQAAPTATILSNLNTKLSSPDQDTLVVLEDGQSLELAVQQGFHKFLLPNNFKGSSTETIQQLCYNAKSYYESPPVLSTPNNKPLFESQAAATRALGTISLTELTAYSNPCFIEV